MPAETQHPHAHLAATPHVGVYPPGGYLNDGHRWQVASDGKRFLMPMPAGENRTSPIDITVNWQSLLEK